MGVGNNITVIAISKFLRCTGKKKKKVTEKSKIRI